MIPHTSSTAPPNFQRCHFKSHFHYSYQIEIASHGMSCSHQSSKQVVRDETVQVLYGQDQRQRYTIAELSLSTWLHAAIVLSLDSGLTVTNLHQHWWRQRNKMSSVLKATIENKTTSVITHFKEINNRKQRVYCQSYCLK